MKTYSQGTETWKETMKGVVMFAYDPIQAVDDVIVNPTTIELPRNGNSPAQFPEDKGPEEVKPLSSAVHGPVTSAGNDGGDSKGLLNPTKIVLYVKQCGRRAEASSFSIKDTPAFRADPGM